jgi:hypothetical protein
MPVVRTMLPVGLHLSEDLVAVKASVRLLVMGI